MVKKEFAKWLESKPQVIHDLVEKVKPWHDYRIKTTGQHCHLLSYSENGTVTVFVSGHDSEALNQAYHVLPITVFGIKPEDLEIIE